MTPCLWMLETGRCDNCSLVAHRAALAIDPPLQPVPLVFTSDQMRIPAERRRLVSEWERSRLAAVTEQRRRVNAAVEAVVSKTPCIRIEGETYLCAACLALAATELIEVADAVDTTTIR